MLQSCYSILVSRKSTNCIVCLAHHMFNLSQLDGGYLVLCWRCRVSPMKLILLILRIKCTDHVHYLPIYLATIKSTIQGHTFQVEVFIKWCLFLYNGSRARTSQKYFTLDERLSLVENTHIQYFFRSHQI